MGSLTTSLLPTSRARLVTRDSIYYYRLSNAKTCLCEDTATDNFLGRGLIQMLRRSGTCLLS